MKNKDKYNLAKLKFYFRPTYDEEYIVYEVCVSFKNKIVFKTKAYTVNEAFNQIMQWLESESENEK